MSGKKGRREGRGEKNRMRTCRVERPGERMEGTQGVAPRACRISFIVTALLF